MKGGRSGGRPHALPIPSAAMAVIEAYWKEADGDEPSPFAFPSLRGEGPVSQGSINQLLHRLQGITNNPAKARLGKPSRKRKPLPPRVDLFARCGIEPWVPHDARRTLGTFLDDQRLGGAGSAILAHRPAKTENEREKVEAVTRLHYAKSQRLGLKAEGMALWVAAVLEAYEAEKAKMLGHAKAA
jgi:integrase